MFGFLKSKARKSKDRMLGVLGRFGVADERKLAAALLSVRAGFDLAKTTNENRKHWAAADALSGQAWASPSERRKLRVRARYEIFNNGYGKGMVEKIALHTIGTGPRLQMKIANNDEANSRVERLFNEWSRAVNLPETLRRMVKAEVIDGEAFGVFVESQRGGKVRLGIRLYEADQIATPRLTSESSRSVDGIDFDDNDEPKTYYILKDHPGDPGGALFSDPIPISANRVIHYFMPERPGQKRGVTRLASVIGMFANLRRYDMAVISAAEIAAAFAALLKTPVAPDSEESQAEPFSSVEIERILMMALPDGYDVMQLKAEQPTTQHKDFEDSVINQLGQPLVMPFNITKGNSSTYNYASGRLDHQTYFKAIAVAQNDIEIKILERVFSEWLSHATLIEDFLPQEARRQEIPPHEWFWDGLEHVDPAKQENADDIAIRNKTKSRASVCARRGDDWERTFEQIAREEMKADQLGIVLDNGAAPPIETEGDDA